VLSDACAVTWPGAHLINMRFETLNFGPEHAFDELAVE